MSLGSNILIEDLAKMRIENKALRDEVARLNRAMSIATIALRYYSETAIGARAVDALEKIEAKS